MRLKKNSFFLVHVCTFLLFLSFLTFALRQSDKSLYPNPNETRHNPVSLYEGEADENMSDVMTPIPMKDRVFNKTGIQCVWASLECIGRYASEIKLFDLTKDRDCQSYSSPSNASWKLKKLGVKFEQTNSIKDRSLIKKAIVVEKRGVLFGIPGHAMVMVHYDEDKKIIKYINNSDKELKIRTWKMSEFDQRWDGWICAIYADNDIIHMKTIASQIKIVDYYNNFIVPNNYILFPN